VNNAAISNTNETVEPPPITTVSYGSSSSSSSSSSGPSVQGNVVVHISNPIFDLTPRYVDERENERMRE
jgi:hypothetical protein